jgi:integrase
VIRSKGLGSAAIVTLAQARRAREDFVVRRRSGEMPRGRNGRVAGKLFGEAARAFLDIHSDEWGASQQKLVAGLFRLYAVPLDSRPVGRITREEVAAVLKPIWTGPGHSQGSRLRGLLERIFRAQNVEPNPAEWSRLEHLLSRRAAEVESHPSLPYAQLPPLMVELMADKTLQARATRFLILTGVRLSEALGACWEEIDLVAKEWAIPAARMKMKQDHVVPLSDAAISCLGSRGAGWLFPSSRRGHIKRNGMHKFLNKFKRLDRAGKPITLHGFRATISTWAQDQQF